MGGNVPGHVIPGLGLLLLCLYVLTFILYKVKTKSWTQERAIRFGGLMQIIIGGIGNGVEIVNGMQWHRPFQAKEHITMYTSYMISGMLFMMESRGRLAQETWRSALGMTNLVVGLLFYVHSQMQMMDEHNPIESFVHWLMALACFCSSVSFFLSWLLPSTRLGCLYMGLAALMTQSNWFFFLAYALYSGDFGKMAEELPMGDATAYFVWCGFISILFISLFEYKLNISGSTSTQAAESEAPQRSFVVEPNHSTSQSTMEKKRNYLKLDHQEDGDAEVGLMRVTNNE